MKQQGRAPAGGLTAGWRVAGALLMLAAGLILALVLAPLAAAAAIRIAMS